MDDPGLRVEDLGRMSYAAAYERQVGCVERVLAARAAERPIVGTLLLVEHDPPVITVSRRPTAKANLVASEESLAAHGVTVAATDRGGDITYHGPGQLVAYPILDLNLLSLGLHGYMRLLERAVIETCSALGVEAFMDATATGVWVGRGEDGRGLRKICAMGVRVRRWVSMHGLALNVDPNLDHFRLIVPCGLADRGVASVAGEVGAGAPAMERVKAELAGRIAEQVAQRQRAPSASSG